MNKNNTNSNLHKIVEVDINDEPTKVKNEYLDIANVAFSGNYVDLINKPTIPSKTSELTNDSGFITSTGSVENANIANIALSVNYANVTSKPNFAAIATSGSYNDLTNTPIIPSKTSDLINNSGFITIDDVPSGLPPQANHVGEYLTTDGSSASWSILDIPDPLPSQTGNAGKVLSTNGTTTLWITQSGGSGNGPILKKESTRPIAYVGYQNKIVKLDYTLLPPTISKFDTTDLNVDWESRTTLPYTAC